MLQICRFVPPASAVLLLGLPVGTALAETQNWSLPGSGDWFEPLNWSAQVPDAADEVAVFGSGLTDIFSVVSLDGQSATVGEVHHNGSGLLRLNLGELALDVSGAGGTARLMTGVGAGDLTLATGVSFLDDNLHVDAAAGTSVFLDGVIAADSLDLSMVGVGELWLRGNNTGWTGDFEASSGAVFLMHSNALGAASTSIVSGGAVHVRAASGEAFDVQSGTLLIDTGAVAHAGAVTLSGGSLNSVLGGRLGGGLVLESGPGSTVGAGLGIMLLVSGGVSGAGDLLLTPEGTVRFESAGLSHDGSLVVDSGRVELLVDSAHTGMTTINGGALLVNGAGSLVNSDGPIIVQAGGTFGVDRDAGEDALLHSVGLNSIHMNGGALLLQSDLDPTGFLNAASTGGALLLDNVSGFTAGATDLIDFSVLPAGGGLTLGAVGDSSLSATLVLVPDSSRTLRLGAGGGTLTVDSILTDGGGTPVQVLHDGLGTTRLTASNTYIGETHITGGVVEVTNPSGLGGLSAGTFVSGGGVLSLYTPVAETIHLDAGQLRLDAAGVYTSPLFVQTGTLQAGFGGLMTYSGPIDVANELSLIHTAVGGRLNLDNIVSGAGQLTISQGQVALQGENTYTGLTTISGASQVDVEHAMGLGNDSSGTIIEGSALVGLHATSNEPITVSGGTLRLTDASVLYTNPIILDGGVLRSQDDSGLVVVQLDTGLTLTDSSSLVASDGLHLLGDLTGAGDLGLSAFQDVVFAGGVNLAGRLSLTAGAGGVVFEGLASVEGLTVQNQARVEVHNGLAVNDTITLDGTARLEWYGGALSAEQFQILGQHSDVRLVLGTGVDLTGLVDGAATGAALVLVGSLDDLPGIEITSGAVVRQTGDDLTTASNLWVGTAQGPGTLRLEGGSLNTGTLYVGGSGSSAVEIAGGSLNTNLRLAEGAGTEATLRISAGSLGTTNLSLGLGGAARVEQSGGTADIGILTFGEAAGPGGVYELSNSGVLNVQTLVLDNQSPATLRINGGTMTLANEYNDSYEGPGTASIEINGGSFSTGQMVLRAFPNDASYTQTGGTANFSLGLTVQLNASFQFSGGTLNTGVLSIDGQPDTIAHTGGNIVADFFTLSAQTNNPLRYELSDGGIVATERFQINGSFSSTSSETIAFVQTGGGVSAPNEFVIAGSFISDTPTRYELVGGTLNAGSYPGLDVATFGNGDDNRAEFFQTGGIATFDELRLLNAEVRVVAGTMNLNTLLVSAGGPDVATLFEQTGGNVNVAGLMELASVRSNNVDARYRLIAGILSAGSGQVGGEQSDVLGNIEQTGGTATFGLLSIASNGAYDLTGGTLGIRAGLVNNGALDLHSSGATVRAESGILDLATTPLLNATNANITGFVGSVITLPTGFDVATEFGSFNNAGVTHFRGDTLFIPVGPGLVASGDINDHVETRSDITAAFFGPLNLLGGLRMIGGVRVDLGPDGSAQVLNSISGMDGGMLRAQELLVGTVANNGPDARFVMDGGVINLASIDDSSQEPGTLRISSRTGAESSFVLNDGQIVIDGENQSTSFTVSASGGTATFEQHGGSVLLPGANGRFSTGGSTSTGTAHFIMTDGTLTAEDGGFLWGSAIELQGGTLNITRFADLRRSHNNQATFSVSGGTFIAPIFSLDAHQTDRLTSFNVSDGLVQVGRFQSDTATIQVSGGRFEADTVEVTSINFGTDQFYSELIQSGGAFAAATSILVGDAGGSTLLRLSGGEFDSPIITLSGRGGLTTVELLAPGVRMRATDRLIIGEGTILSAVDGATIHLDTASLEMSSTSASNMAGLENLTILAEGNLDIEVGGQDLGATLAGFDNNFALRELILGDDDIGLARIVDETDNALADAQDEALYVDRLVLGAGSGLNLNGLNIYYHQFIDLGGLVLTDGGALIHVPLNQLGDASGDDFVGIEDLDILLVNWGDSVTPGDTALGDVSGDGLVGQADLDIVIAHWGQGIVPQNVPEPATALTLLFGTAAVYRRRRQVLAAA